jgi:hypothetical protein
MFAPQQCGVGMGMGGGLGAVAGGMGGFGWDRYQEYATTM